MTNSFEPFKVDLPNPSDRQSLLEAYVYARDDRHYFGLVDAHYPPCPACDEQARHIAEGKDKRGHTLRFDASPFCKSHRTRQQLVASLTPRLWNQNGTPLRSNLRRVTDRYARDHKLPLTNARPFNARLISARAETITGAPAQIIAEHRAYLFGQVGFTPVIWNPQTGRVLTHFLNDASNQTLRLKPQ